MPDDDSDGLHRCPVQGCLYTQPRKLLMCASHWYKVPAELRRQVYNAWNNGNPSKQYMAIRQKAVDAVNAKLCREPETDLPTSRHGTVTNRGTCRPCGEEILWVRTKNDRAMPVDPETDESHFSSCPSAHKMRGGGRP